MGEGGCQMIAKLLFFVFAILAMGSAVGVVTRRNPIHSGISLLVTFFSFACIYILLNAQFIAVIQITIYAGAILVLELFVIMLLNLREPGPKFIDLVTGSKFGISALLVSGVFALQMAIFWLLKSYKIPNIGGQYDSGKIAENGAIKSLSEVLFNDYLYPFEVASVLLLVAIIGAVILTRREKAGEKNGGEKS